MECETFTYQNAVVRVHFPDITDEENRKRMKKIRQAAEELLKDKKRGKEKKA
jgi:ribosome recycling factor